MTRRLERQASQDGSPGERAATVAAVVELDRILLRSARVVSAVDPEALPANLVPRQLLKASYLTTGAGNLMVSLSLSLDLSPPTPRGADSILSTEADFELRYRIPASKGPFADPELESFAEVNGLLHVWPYWRELVSSMASRAGLTPVTLPVLRFDTTVGPRSRREGGGMRPRSRRSPGDG